MLLTIKSIFEQRSQLHVPKQYEQTKFVPI